MKLALALTLIALAGPTLAQDAPPPDPEGTARVDLEVGDVFDAPARAGGRVICDDPEVVGPELADDGGTSLVLRALKPGSTLCGVRQAGEIPGGLYRVTVRPKEKKGAEPKKKAPGAEEQAPDAGY